MNRYYRLPSLVVLLMVFGAGALYMHRYGRASGNGGQGIEALEALIKKQKDHPVKETWLSYAEALSSAGQFDRAAQAYKKVLELDPPNRQAKFGCALALAEAKKSEDLYAYVKDMVFAEPKLAMDVLDRPELSEFMSDGKFQALQREAKAQAMD
jgi:tetratricopeptide (TPR) repeat protein